MSSIPLLYKIVIFAVPIVFAITVHEVAHGWVASRLGDQTARMMGRLTLNPFTHMDPIGTVLLPLVMIITTGIAFGWAKPVPVDWRNLRNPKRDMALVAIAGPAANLLMLVLWVAILALTENVPGEAGFGAVLLSEMAAVGIIINIILIVLNLLPLPPLDGSRVVAAFLSPAMAVRYHSLEKWGLLILVVLLFTGILGRILQPMVVFFLSLVDLAV